jgi:hypothetical protein
MVKNNKYASVAIGGPETFKQADTEIDTASIKGNWVLVKNVHLAQKWLEELEKKLH